MCVREQRSVYVLHRKSVMVGYCMQKKDGYRKKSDLLFMIHWEKRRINKS